MAMRVSPQRRFFYPVFPVAHASIPPGYVGVNRRSEWQLVRGFASGLQSCGRRFFLPENFVAGLNRVAAQIESGDLQERNRTPLRDAGL